MDCAIQVSLAQFYTGTLFALNRGLKWTDQH